MIRKEDGSAHFLYTEPVRNVKKHPALFYFCNGAVSVAGKLNDRQQLFVDEYMVDRNATQAAIRAGYSEKTARYASEWLNEKNLQKPTSKYNPAIAAAIAARRTAVSEKLEITQEWVLQRLRAIAGADAADYVEVETAPAQKLGIHPITGEVVMLPAGWEQYVKVIDTADLPPEKRAAIAGIKQGRNGIEVKLHDSLRALDMLGKYLGLFDTNAAAPQGQENNLFDAIVGNAEEDLETDEIPELEQEATAGDDVVEPSEV